MSEQRNLADVVDIIIAGLAERGYMIVKADEIASLRAGANNRDELILTLIGERDDRDAEIASLRAKLESARKALENEREFWAGNVASAMIRKLPSDDAQDHVDRITAALTDETGK